MTDNSLYIQVGYVDPGQRVVVLRGTHIGKVGTVVSFNPDGWPNVRLNWIETDVHNPIPVPLLTDVLGILWDGTAEDLERIQPIKLKYPAGTKVLVQLTHRRAVAIVLDAYRGELFVLILNGGYTTIVNPKNVLPYDAPRNVAYIPHLTKKWVRPQAASPPPKAEPPPL